MADSSTTNYNFTKPEVGASSNTWGNKINANWDSIDGILKGIEDGSTKILQAGASSPSSDIGPLYRRDFGSMAEWTTYNLNTANYTGYASVDIGKVDYVGTPALPKGSMKLNGASYSKTAYAALWNWALHNGVVVALGSWTVGTFKFADNGDGTFKIPDLRGVFVRNAADGSSVDSGRAIGSFQANQNKAHTHTFSGSGTAASDGAHTHSVSVSGSAISGGGGNHDHQVVIANSSGTFIPLGRSTGSGGWGVNMSAASNSGAAKTYSSGTHTHSVSMTSTGTADSNGAHTHAVTVTGSVASDGGTESRPDNVALLAVMRF